MKDMRLRIGGTLLFVMLAFLFLIEFQQGFTPFDYASFPIEESLAATEKGISYGVSYALWDQRSLDLIVLALLLFAASACCASILDSQRNEKG